LFPEIVFHLFIKSYNTVHYIYIYIYLYLFTGIEAKHILLKLEDFDVSVFHSAVSSYTFATKDALSISFLSNISRSSF